jgi:glycosyltransferase involved in cell wall biosynthesis
VIGGVRWLSIPPGTGYGDASESYLAGLREAGVDVAWTPLGWPSDIWDAPYGPISELAEEDRDGMNLDVAGRSIDHDTVVVCSTPLWHRQLATEADGRRLVAFTTWETDRLPGDWVTILNRYDRVLVPSRFNAEVLAKSGVNVPVAVVPHIARRPVSADTPAAHDTLVFYMIATWTTRKAIPDAVSAFTDAFTADDDVELVIHTTPEDLTSNGNASWLTLASELAQRPNVPRIMLSTRRLTRSEVADLHRRGDCFVSLSRGEGWGLGAFEAGANGNPAVVTGWGGTLDFLPPGYPYCVAYDLVPTITETPDAWWQPQPGERWARARVAHASTLLRRVFEDREEAGSWGRALQQEIHARYSSESVTRRLIEALS